jgi:antitoxin FitA
MENLSIRKLDDDTVAAHHCVSVEEDVQRIAAPKRLATFSIQFFGAESGVELELPQHTPHEPLSFT